MLMLTRESNTDLHFCADERQFGHNGTSIWQNSNPITGCTSLPQTNRGMTAEMNSRPYLIRWRHWLILAVGYLILAGLNFAGDTGKIAGRISDRDKNEPLIGANVIVTHRWFDDREQPLDYPQGAASDLSGRYFVLNVQPGVYTVQANFIGYRSEIRTRVVVFVDKTTYVDFELVPRALEGESVTVVAQRREAVEVDLTATKQVYQVSEVQSIAGVSDITDIIALQADVVDDHFRGGRVGESVYLLGAGAIVNPLTNARAFRPIVTALEQVEVYTSGFSAEYGNAQSGVINMVTKEGSGKWESRLELSTTLPYYKTWEESVRKKAFSYNGGSPYSSNSLDFYRLLNNDEEWLKENPVYPGRPLYDPGYGFGPKYLPQRIVFPPNWLTHADSIQIAHLGRAQWLMAVRDVGMQYRNRWDNRIDFSTGGPLSETMRIFLAGRQSMINCEVPTTDPDINRQMMGSLIWQKDIRDKLKVTMTVDESNATYFNSSWQTWLFDRTLATSQTAEFSRQLGLEWKHVFNNATFLDVKSSLLGLNRQRRVTLLKDNEYTTDYLKYSNWTDYTAPSNHRVGRPTDDTQDEKTLTWNLSSNVTSQINNSNLLRGGLQFFYYDVVVDNVNNRYSSADVRYIKFKVNPYEGALFLQNKMEFEGLIANIGLRADFFQLHTEYYADLYSPLRNPYYNPDPAKPYYEWGSYYSDSLAARKTTRPYFRVQPRIGISFPVSETMVFHLNYGTFTQRPNFNQLFFNEINSNNEIQVLGNPRLKPEITNAYDIGIVKGFRQTGITLDVSAYYKDVKDLVETAYYYDAQQQLYRTYINRDYADIKGFHVNLERNDGMIRGYIRYNYESATGKSSNELNAPVTYFETADPNYGFVDLPDPEDVYLDYDRTHKVVVNLRYATPNKSGLRWGKFYPLANLSASVTMRYMTGRPYTDPGQGKLFGERTPDEQEVNLRFEKGVRFKGRSAVFYIECFNLLNEYTWSYSRTFDNNYNTPRWLDANERKYILTYKEYTPYITSQDIYLLENEPRHWRVGLIFKF